MRTHGDILILVISTMVIYHNIFKEGKKVSTAPTEVKQISANGGALGLFGLAIVTFIGSANFLGFTAVPDATPWIMGLAVFAHMIASFIGFKSNDIFGGTVFAAYGLFWFSMGIRGLLANGIFGSGATGEAMPSSLAAGATPELGFAFLGYLIFSIMMVIASTRTNKLLVIIISLIAILFLGLTLSTFGLAPEVFGFIANISRFILSLVCFYAVGAIVINTMVGRDVWPVGAKKTT